MVLNAHVRLCNVPPVPLEGSVIKTSYEVEVRHEDAWRIITTLLEQIRTQADIMHFSFDGAGPLFDAAAMAYASRGTDMRIYDEGDVPDQKKH